MDDQADCYRRLEEAFFRYATDQNERLLARWEPEREGWRFEGSGFSSRTFTALASDAQAQSHLEATGRDLWNDWLRALRMNDVRPVGPDSTMDRFVEYDMAATMLVPLPTKLDRLFSRSAVFCLEWATELSSRLRFFEQIEQEESGSQSEQPGFGALYGTSAPDISSFLSSALNASSVENIKRALQDGRRKDAALHWLAIRRSQSLRATKSAIYEGACQDKAEYYRWERGELPRDSRAARDIESVLLRPDDESPHSPHIPPH